MTFLFLFEAFKLIFVKEVWVGLLSLTVGRVLVEELQPGSRKTQKEGSHHILFSFWLQAGPSQAPGLPAVAAEASLPWRFPQSPPPSPVQLETGIHSRPAGWMAPISCPANVGCLPRLLSDSTISQWHPGTHRTSRKNDVLQKQTHVARADGNSRSHVHNEALDIPYGLWYSEAWHELGSQDNQPTAGILELATQIVRGCRKDWGRICCTQGLSPPSVSASYIQSQPLTSWVSLGKLL